MNYFVPFFITAIVSIPFLQSCGRIFPGDNKSIQQRSNEVLVDDSGIDGLYNAKFETLNPHVNGTIPGSATFYFTGDRLLTYIRLFAGGARAWHQQGVYLGNRCPNLGDDKNLDGFIDIDEAMAVIGKMVIPLDANMNSQYAGRNYFPIGDFSGYYHYERVSSFQRLVEDLRAEDPEPDDFIVKIKPNESFTLFGKVVLVQGVAEETILPETVVGQGKRKSYQALPITCGIIKRVQKSPGSPNSEEIPGPISDVEAGQDHPSSGGSDISYTTGGSDSGSSTSGGSTSGSSTTGGSATGSSTTGGSTTGSSTSGGSTSGGSTSGGTGETETGNSTTGGETSGGTR